MPHARTCRAPRTDGSPCISAIVLPSGFCHPHDPDRRESIAGARAKGGQGKSRIARAERLVPASLRPTIAVLFDALQEVHDGHLEPKQGQAMAALAGAIARLYSVGVLEERIAALETTEERQHA